MRFDERVHSPSVSLEMRAILWRGNLERLASSDSKPQNSLLAVVLDKLAAQNLGNFSGGESSHDIHLP